MLIVELKSDALKERHWRQLCRALKVDWSLSELTLGQVWDADLLHNEHTVKDVVSVAQGEMALEEFLKQVCICSIVLYVKQMTDKIIVSVSMPIKSISECNL